jgi:hypothetical protein
MAIYSSAFDPRHFYDLDATNIAFVEFITALLFGHSVKIASGSLFDCIPLHNIWLSFFDSFERNSDRYMEYGLLPLRIMIDEHKFPYRTETNIPLKIAHDYLSGRIVNIDGYRPNLASDEFEFSVMDRNEIDVIRSKPSFDKLGGGVSECLSELRNSLFCRSLMALNSYCNRWKAFEFVRRDDRIDILQCYMEGCHQLAVALGTSKLDLANEISEGLEEIKDTPAQLRQSTSTLIKHARKCFPNIFDPVIMPISRALSSQLTAGALQAEMSVNYELNRIMKYDYAVFEAARQVLHNTSHFSSDNIFFRPPLEFSDASSSGKLAMGFDWNAFHDVLLHPTTQSRISRIKTANNARDKRQAFESHANAISKEMIDLLSLQIEYVDGNSIYLSVNLDHKEPGIFKYVVKIIDKMVEYIPVDIGKDFVLSKIRESNMKNAILAICPIAGGI